MTLFFLPMVSNLKIDLRDLHYSHIIHLNYFFIKNKYNLNPFIMRFCSSTIEVTKLNVMENILEREDEENYM